MKLLVLATGYSKPDGSISLQYIHSRNQWYLHHGIDVSVVSFDAETDYELDNVKVYTLRTYEQTVKHEHFDLLISHAPNLRNHYRFIKTYGDLYEKIIFFFHGHEVLKLNEVYPKPYAFTAKTPITTTVTRWIYDRVKLLFWRNYFKKIAHKSHFVFVSKWMYQMFLASVKMDPTYIEGRTSIIYNCIGENFETNSYDTSSPKTYDFITIRNNLDGAKYAIDVVTAIARQHPQYRFCVIGKGAFYHHYEQPANLEWIDQSPFHEELITYLKQARCALIPTRTDSQGVMACEMATFGIPVITSDIDVCTEVFDDFPNVSFISNDAKEYHITPLFNALREGLPYEKKETYFSKNTIAQEVALFETLAKNKTDNALI